MNVQTAYQRALVFAAKKHLHHTLPDNELPYLVHICNVAMEILTASGPQESFDLAFAVEVALLHDTIEDAGATVEELEQHFGSAVATAVMALSKNEKLSKEKAIPDSVQRIKELRKEVWMVKLADRITNLQVPDKDDDEEEIKRYRSESEMILRELGPAHPLLAARLQEKIEEYRRLATVS